MSVFAGKKIVFVVNVDWYFCLHWQDRALSLKKAGAEVVVVSRNTSTKHFKHLETVGIRAVDWACSRKRTAYFSHIVDFFSLVKTLVKLRPDLICSVTVKPSVLSAVYSSIMGIPQFVAICGLGALSASKAKSRTNRFIFTLMGWLFRGNRLVYVENEADKKCLVSKAGVEVDNILISPGAGVDVAMFSPSASSARKAPFKVAHIARFLKSKGLCDAYMAVSELAKRNEIRLIVAGIEEPENDDCIEKEVLEKIAATDFVDWRGHSTEVDKLLRQADVLLYPSSYGEGLPRILLEAAATGKPVVTYDVAGSSRAVVHGLNGYVHRVGDIEGLVDSLSRLMQDDARRESMGAAGRALVIKEFSNAVALENFSRAVGRLF